MVAPYFSLGQLRDAESTKNINIIKKCFLKNALDSKWCPELATKVQSLLLYSTIRTTRKHSKHVELTP